MLERMLQFWNARKIARAELKADVPKEQRRLVMLVGVALLINHFDLNISSFALPQIQRAFNVPEEQLGIWIAISRLGVLGAFILGFSADRVGRRAVLMWTIIGTTLVSLTTAFAQTAFQYFALQTLMRALAYAEEIVCFVVVVEVMAKNRRGWAVGRLSALGTLGAGIAAGLYGAFGGMTDGWRILYIIGGVGLAFLAIARRSLKETDRFQTALDERKAATEKVSVFAPLISLVRESPGRFLALAATTIPFIFGTASAIAFVSKRFQNDLGYTPHGMAMLFIAGGALSYNIYYVGGSLTDRFGRKRSLFITIPLCALMYGVLYLSPHVVIATGAWVVALSLMFMSEMILSMLGSELFSTDRRSTAAGARVAIGVVAGAVGLATESLLYGYFGSHTATIAALLCVAPLSLVALLFLPETASRELEEISAPASSSGPS